MESCPNTIRYSIDEQNHGKKHRSALATDEGFLPRTDNNISLKDEISLKLTFGGFMLIIFI